MFDGPLNNTWGQTIKHLVLPPSLPNGHLLTFFPFIDQTFFWGVRSIQVIPNSSFCFQHWFITNTGVPAHIETAVFSRYHSKIYNKTASETVVFKNVGSEPLQQTDSQHFRVMCLSEKKYVNRECKQGRTQTEEEISALAEMSRAASLFPSSLPETDRRACTQLKCQLVLKGDTLPLGVWLKCQRTKLSPPPRPTPPWHGQ